MLQHPTVCQLLSYLSRRIEPDAVISRGTRTNAYRVAVGLALNTAHAYHTNDDDVQSSTHLMWAREALCDGPEGDGRTLVRGLTCAVIIAIVRHNRGQVDLLLFFLDYDTDLEDVADEFAE